MLALAEGSNFSWSRRVDMMWWNPWEGDITVVELETGTRGNLTDYYNLCPKFLNETFNDYLLILVSSPAPTRLVNGWFQRNKQFSSPLHSLSGNKPR